MPAFKVCAVAVARVGGPTSDPAHPSRRPAAAVAPTRRRPRATHPTRPRGDTDEQHAPLPARRLPVRGTGAGQARPDRRGADATRCPTGVSAQALYFRGGNSTDELVTVVLMRDGEPMRYFPIGAQGRRARAAAGGRGPRRRHRRSSCTSPRPRGSPARSSSTSAWWRSDARAIGRWPHPEQPDDGPTRGWSSSATAWPAPAPSRRSSPAAAASSSRSPSSATSRTATTTGSCSSNVLAGEDDRGRHLPQRR